MAEFREVSTDGIVVENGLFVIKVPGSEFLGIVGSDDLDGFPRVEDVSHWKARVSATDAALTILSVSYNLDRHEAVLNLNTPIGVDPSLFNPVIVETDLPEPPTNFNTNLKSQIDGDTSIDVLGTLDRRHNNQAAFNLLMIEYLTGYDPISNIDDGDIDHDHLATDAVETDNIKNEAVTEPKLADDSVSTRTIEDGAITHPKLATDAVENENIKTKTIHGTKLQEGTVSSLELGTDSVIVGKIAKGAVTHPKIAQDAVSNIHLASSAVHEDNILNKAVTSDKLASDASADASADANRAVGTDHIKKDAVTFDRLAQPVRTMIKNLVSEAFQGAYSSTKVYQQGQIVSYMDPATPSSGVHFFLFIFDNVTANVSGQAPPSSTDADPQANTYWHAVYFDLPAATSAQISAETSGEFWLNPAALKAGLQGINNLINSKNMIAHEVVENDQIKTGTIKAGRLHIDSVETDKIKNRNVTEPKLANDAVVNRTIENNAVSKAKLDGSLQTEIEKIDQIATSNVSQEGRLNTLQNRSQGIWDRLISNNAYSESATYNEGDVVVDTGSHRIYSWQYHTPGNEVPASGSIASDTDNVTSVRPWVRVDLKSIAERYPFGGSGEGGGGGGGLTVNTLAEDQEFPATIEANQVGEFWQKTTLVPGTKQLASVEIRRAIRSSDDATTHEIREDKSMIGGSGGSLRSNVDAENYVSVGVRTGTDGFGSAADGLEIFIDRPWGNEDPSAMGYSVDNQHIYIGVPDDPDPGHQTLASRLAGATLWISPEGDQGQEFRIGGVEIYQVEDPDNTGTYNRQARRGNIEYWRALPATESLAALKDRLNGKPVEFNVDYGTGGNTAWVFTYDDTTAEQDVWATLLKHPGDRGNVILEEGQDFPDVSTLSERDIGVVYHKQIKEPDGSKRFTEQKVLLAQNRKDIVKQEQDVFGTMKFVTGTTTIGNRNVYGYYENDDGSIDIGSTGNPFAEGQHIYLDHDTGASSARLWVRVAESEDRPDEDLTAAAKLFVKNDNSDYFIEETIHHNHAASTLPANDGFVVFATGNITNAAQIINLIEVLNPVADAANNVIDARVTLGGEDRLKVSRHEVNVEVTNPDLVFADFGGDEIVLEAAPTEVGDLDKGKVYADIKIDPDTLKIDHTKSTLKLTVQDSRNKKVTKTSFFRSSAHQQAGYKSIVVGGTTDHFRGYKPEGVSVQHIPADSTGVFGSSRDLHDRDVFMFTKSSNNQFTAGDNENSIYIPYRLRNAAKLIVGATEADVKALETDNTDSTITNGVVIDLRRSSDLEAGETLESYVGGVNINHQLAKNYVDGGDLSANYRHYSLRSGTTSGGTALTDLGNRLRAVIGSGIGGSNAATETNDFVFRLYDSEGNILTGYDGQYLDVLQPEDKLQLPTKGLIPAETIPTIDTAVEDNEYRKVLRDSNDIVVGIEKRVATKTNKIELVSGTVDEARSIEQTNAYRTSSSVNSNQFLVYGAENLIQVSNPVDAVTLSSTTSAEFGVMFTGNVTGNFFKFYLLLSERGAREFDIPDLALSVADTGEIGTFFFDPTKKHSNYRWSMSITRGDTTYITPEGGTDYGARAFTGTNARLGVFKMGVDSSNSTALQTVKNGLSSRGVQDGVYVFILSGTFASLVGDNSDLIPSSSVAAYGLSYNADTSRGPYNRRAFYALPEDELENFDTSAGSRFYIHRTQSQSVTGDEVFDIRFLDVEGNSIFTTPVSTTTEVVTSTRSLVPVSPIQTLHDKVKPAVPQGTRDRQIINLSDKDLETINGLSDSDELIIGIRSKSNEDGSSDWGMNFKSIYMKDLRALGTSDSERIPINVTAHTTGSPYFIEYKYTFGWSDTSEGKLDVRCLSTGAAEFSEYIIRIKRN